MLVKNGDVMSFKEDLSDSAYDFLRCVYPAIEKHVGGGELIPTETLYKNEIFKKLDIHSGIDAWQLHTKHGIRGIASRVQWGNMAWNTFTIRYVRSSGAKTEYEKRLAAVKSNDGWIYPYYTVHAYINERGGNGELMSAAITKTKDLYTFAEMGLKKRDITKHSTPHKIRQVFSDNNLFISIDWMDYKHRNNYIIIVKQNGDKVIIERDKPKQTNISSWM